MEKVKPQGNYLEIVKHYESCLDKYGDTHLGVDWPNKKDAQKRYKVMLDIIQTDGNSPVTLLDFGSGMGHLYDYMQENNYSNIKYAGLDISPKFIQLSKIKYPHIPFYCLDILVDDKQMPETDYVLMNGVFTEKQNLTFDEMNNYFQQMISKIFAKAKQGIAFNLMSKQVDWEREDLFHLSMDQLATFLRTKVSRNFVFRYDYGLYEYTVYLYKNPSL